MSSAVNVQEERSKLLRLQGILSSFSPSNTASKFSKVFCRVNDGEDSGLVPGFSLNIPIAEKPNAEFLAKLFKGSEKNFPYPVKVTVASSGASYVLNVSSNGDIYKAIMKNPRYSHAIDLEQFVRYTVFRTLCQQLSLQKVYNMDFSNPRDPAFNVRSHAAINDIVEKHLTKHDLEKIAKSGDLKNPSLPVFGRVEQGRKVGAGYGHRPGR